MVVTGSYLRQSDTFDAASPLKIINRDFIESQGHNELSYIALDQSYVMGSSTRPGLGGGNQLGFSNINLRGLGSGNTMRLLNGKRVTLNGNHIAPTIAVRRLETLLDGASALYGSDAIGGVVNYITRSRFEGVEVVTGLMTDDDTHGIDEETLSFIAGKDFGSTHAVLAFEWIQHENVPLGIRSLPAAGDSFFGKTYRFPFFANPGAVGVDPEFAAAYSGIAGFNPDLNCSDVPGSVPGHSGLGCGYTYANHFPVSAAVDRKVTLVTFDHDLKGNLNLYGSLGVTRGKTSGTSAEFPWTSFLPIIPRFNPGLANDARLRGVPEGTPLSELVFIGRHGMGFPVDEFVGNRARQNSDRVLLGIKGDYAAFDSWSWDLSVQVSDWQVEDRRNTNMTPSRLRLALAGLGGADCNSSDPLNVSQARAGLQNVDGSGCYFYNPFLSATYSPSGQAQTDLRLINPPELISWLKAPERFSQRYENLDIDLLSKGELTAINERAVTMAVGLQFRQSKLAEIKDEGTESGDIAFGAASPSFRIERKVWALFTEATLPVTSSVDLQLALRYENYLNETLHSLDPKLSMVWRAGDSLRVRASYSTAFRAPDRLRSNSSNVITINETISDPLNNNAAFNLPVITRGNNALEPDEASIWNLGFSWRPMDSLQVDVDIFSHDYSSLIVGESAQLIVNQNPLDQRISRDEAGLITSVESSYINAGGSLQQGVQFGLNYGWDLDWGSFRFGVDAMRLTRMDMNLYDVTCGCLTDIDGLSRRNHDNPFGAIQDIKANSSLTWSLARHGASLSWRHVGGYRNSGGGTPGITRLLEAERNYRCVDPNGSTNFLGIDCGIASHNTFDIAYHYQLPGAFGLSSLGRATIGAVNVTDEAPPAVAMDMGYDVTSHDPRGRLLYLRFKVRVE